MAFNQLCTASITSLLSANFWPRKYFFIGPNKWKSNGAKSGLYGGCFKTSNFRVRSVSTVCAAVWGWALLWSNNTLFETSPLHFGCIAGINLFTSVSLYRALVTAWSYSGSAPIQGHWHPRRWSARLSQWKPVSWNFCWLAKTGASTASIVSYSLVHNGTPKTRLLSQFDGEKHLLQKHDGPNAPDKLSAVHACDHWKTALGPICYTLSYTEVIGDNNVCRSVTHVEFYGNFINSDIPVVTDSLLDLPFHCLSCHANWSPVPVFITDVLSSILKSFHPFIHSPLTQTTGSILNLQSSVDFRWFHTLWPQKTNNTSLLFHGASWQSTGHVVRAIVQAHTAQSSWPLYGILLRSHFVSQNKIFCCAYFSMHFRIKSPLFNDFLS